jgi:hypothetical protein
MTGSSVGSSVTKTSVKTATDVLKSEPIVRSGQRKAKAPPAVARVQTHRQAMSEATMIMTELLFRGCIGVPYWRCQLARMRAPTAAARSRSSRSTIWACPPWRRLSCT